MNQERIEFGSRLREGREARSLSLPGMARTTKIPERTLALLEAGAFEGLPAEVFVRGFLRSYCRAAGLDGEQIVQRYGELVRRTSPTPTTTTTSASTPTSTSTSTGTAKTEDTGALREMLAGAGRGTRRISLTLAVIILVIVATLTLSLLLRRPSHVGDGMSRLDPPAGREV